MQRTWGIIIHERGKERNDGEATKTIGDEDIRE